MTDQPTAQPEQQIAHKLEGIFMPGAQVRRKEHLQRGGRFIHYTSAENALKIIQSKEIWMRNAKCMSDFREVEYGYAHYKTYFQNPDKFRAFFSAIDACGGNAVGTANEAFNVFNKTFSDILMSTYITSLSEHTEEEDSLGRLSMWRAFGGGTGRVGLVLKPPRYSQGSAALNLLFSPINYFTEQQVHGELDSVVSSLADHREVLATIDRNLITRHIFYMLIAGTVCTKHPGFVEEREWRAIYYPNRWESSLMKKFITTVSGIPQHVYKIPLDEQIDSVLADLEFSRIFDRVILGPSQYPWPMYLAFTEALDKAGVPYAHAKVFTSDIPIRS